MTTNLYKVSSGDLPLASDVDQFADALSGANDIGKLTLATSISAPSTVFTATVASGIGLGVGAYKYVLTYVTGYKKTNGTILYAGETTQSASVSVTTTSGNQKVTLGSLPTSWPTTAVGLRVYRTSVGGSTYKLVTTLTTPAASYSDTTADASLGVSVPTSNTTGTSLSGNIDGVNALAHASSLTALAHFENSVITTRGIAGTFTRASAANNPETLASLAANQPAYVTGKYGKSVSINEGTTNLVYNSDFETVTGTATVFSDPLTSYSGSSAAPWTVQGGSFTFGASGATSGANSTRMVAGNSAWKPLTGSGGQNLALTAQATFTTPSTVNSTNDGSLFLWVDSSNYYQVYNDNTSFKLIKIVGGSGSSLASVAQTLTPSTTYTITLSRDTAGLLTAKLYSGTGTGGTLLQTLTATDTSLSGGFLVGVGGDTGVEISNVVVNAPNADGWGATVSACALDSSIKMNGNYSISIIGTAAGGARYDSPNIPVSASTAYTVSVYANIPAGETRQLEVYVTGGTATAYDVDVTGTGAWERYTLTFTTQTGATNAIVRLIDRRTSGWTKYWVDAWQLEAKSYATPYLRNDSTSASATRAAETLTYPSSVLNAAAGTISLWAYEDGTNTTRYLLGTENATMLIEKASNTYQIFMNGTHIMNATQASAGWHLYALKWSGTAVSFYIDGVLSQSATLAATVSFSGVSHLYIGSRSDGALQWNAAIDELAIFNRALTDAEVYSLYAATQPLIDVFASDAQTLSGLTAAQITTNIPNTALTGPLVSSVTGNNGITVSNPTGVGAATLGLSGVPNSALAGPQVSSITAGQNISVSNPGGVGAATVGLSGVVPVANGGTGSATQNFVDLSTTQTIGGAKTFSSGVGLNSGTTVYNGADIGLRAGAGAPNDAGDVVFQNNDGTTRARVHAGAVSTPQLTLQVADVDRVTVDSNGNMSVQNTVSFGGGLTTTAADILLNGPGSTYSSTAASVKVGSIVATDNYGDARPGAGVIAAKYGMTVGGNTVWHSANASGGASVITLFAGANHIYNSVTSGTSATGGNVDFSGSGATSDPPMNTNSLRFTWQSALATGKSVYFEVEMWNGSGGTATAYAALENANSPGTFYGQVSTTGGYIQRVRSGAISIPDGTDLRLVYWTSTSGYPCNIGAARLIII